MTRLHPTIALFLLAALVDALAIALLAKRDLLRALAPAVARLCWAELLALAAVARWIVPQTGACVGDLRRASLLLGVGFWLWMVWDAERKVHPLSGVVLRWLGIATLLKLLLSVSSSPLTGGLGVVVLVLCCGRVAIAAWQWHEDPCCKLEWLPDGRCRLIPHPHSGDYLLRHPELLLRIVAVSAQPDYGPALHALLQERIHHHTHFGLRFGNSDRFLWRSGRNQKTSARHAVDPVLAPTSIAPPFYPSAPWKTEPLSGSAIESGESSPSPLEPAAP